MNTQHLEYILEVYNCGSINKAAKFCYISQSHLSKIIKDLENELGYSLIIRSTSGLDFTRAGKAFIKSAEKIVQECNNIKNLPEQRFKNKALSIACSPDPFLLNTFIDFERASASDGSGDILRETGLRNILRLLISEECHLGVMSMFEQKAAKYHKLAEKYGFEFHTLLTGVSMVVTMSKDHALAKQEQVLLEDILKYPFVVDANVDYDDTQAILKIPPDQNVLHVASLSSMEMALKKSNYISVKMRTIMSYAATNGLCTRPIDDLRELSGIYMIRPEHKPIYDREKQYIAYLKAQLNQWA